MKIDMLLVNGERVDKMISRIKEEELIDFYPPEGDVHCWQFDFKSGSLLASGNVVVFIEGAMDEEEDKAAIGGEKVVGFRKRREEPKQ